MEKILTATRYQIGRYGIIGEELQKELFRKSIHVLIALVPLLASINIGVTLALLGSGTLVYTYTEMLRLSGRRVVLISRITMLAMRDRDQGHFVLGPVTLGIGAMIALLLYPEPAASIAIYSLAFGDSIASIVGKLLGRVRIPLAGGKTLAGSIACFFVVYFITNRITGNPIDSVLIALIATLLELFGSRDLDNIVLPMGTGFAASLLVPALTI